MSTVTSRPTREAKPKKAPRSLPTRSRSTGVIVAGALVVVLGALVGLLASSTGETASVLAVRDQVAPGQTIEQDNLISKNVSGVDGAVLVEEIDTVVGSTATFGLSAGQVLTSASLSTDPIPAPGSSVVGIALNPSQVPADGLAAGDVVRIITVPAVDDPTAGVEAAVIAPRVEVLSIGRSDVGETATLVTVLTPSAQADQIATASATGRAAVIKINAAPAGAAGN